MFTVGEATISWKSSKQTVMTRSTMKYECTALDKCNDPYQIIQVFKTFDQVLSGPKVTFSRMNNFGLPKTPFCRPHRYEFIDGLNVKIRLTDKKVMALGSSNSSILAVSKSVRGFYLKATLCSI